MDTLQTQVGRVLVSANPDVDGEHDGSALTDFLKVVLDAVAQTTASVRSAEDDGRNR